MSYDMAGATSAPDESDGDKTKKSAATMLVDIAEELYDFGVSDTGETFGVPHTGPKVVRLLRGGKTSLRGQLSREYFRRTGKAAPQQALADALLVVEGVAQDAEEEPLYLRTARHGGALWLDLGDQTGRAVRITGNGWTVEAEPPVLFKRTALNAALPEPKAGAALSELWEWLNVAADDRPLVAAWLVATLHPDIPHPVLNLAGEQGTGKTSAEKALVSVLDPSPVATRKPPRDPESWVTAAAGSWVVGLDNLSDVPAWLSDSVCRAVTGDGDVRRKLYTNGDMHVFAFRRCIVLTGIDLGAIRGDLADRLLPIELDRIADERRIEETELWPRWAAAHPNLLAAVLDLVASVESLLPSVRLARKPRMADYARLLAAVDAVLGTEGLQRYLRKQGDLAADSLTGDLFISAIATSITTFTGTAAELLDTVPDPDGRPPKGWPTTPRAVTQRLKRQAPVMRKAGWTVDNDDGANHTNRVRWTITPPSRPEFACNQDSRDSRDSRGGHDQHKQGSPSASQGASQRESANGDNSQDSRSDSQDSQASSDETAGQQAPREDASHASHEYGQSQDTEAGACCKGGTVTNQCQLCPESPSYWKATA